MADLQNQRRMVYEVGIYENSRDGHAEEAMDLFERMGLGPPLRVFLGLFRRDPTPFEELYSRCMSWCRTQKYSVPEKSVDLKTLRAGQAEEDVDDEEEEANMPIDALND